MSRHHAVCGMAVGAGRGLPSQLGGGYAAARRQRSGLQRVRDLARALSRHPCLLRAHHRLRGALRRRKAVPHRRTPATCGSDGGHSCAPRRASRLCDPFRCHRLHPQQSRGGGAAVPDGATILGRSQRGAGADHGTDRPLRHGGGVLRNLRRRPHRRRSAHTRQGAGELGREPQPGRRDRGHRRCRRAFARAQPVAARSDPSSRGDDRWA